jgi:outer membrane protein assembly factor BamB
VSGDIVALDSQGGAELWRHNVGAEVLSPIAGNEEVVIVQTLDGRLIGLSAGSGDALWEYTSTVPVLTMRSVSTPMLIADMAVAGFASGKVVALDASNGKIRWERRVAIPKGRSELDRIVDIDGAMLYRNDLIYVVSYQGNVMGLEPTNGRVIWSAPASSYSGLANGFGNIYVSDAEGSIIALSEANGDIRWQRTELARRRLSDPAAISSYVAVGDFEGYVHFLSQVDGHMSGRVRVDGDGVRAPMIVDGDVLYVYGNSGRLAALKVK